MPFFLPQQQSGQYAVFDLVSTREETDHEIRGCARLLAAVISQAIQDAGSSVSEQEARTHRATGEAGKAIRWLFTKGTFDLYCNLIGISPENLRKALLEKHSLPPKQKRSKNHQDSGMRAFTEINRRNLQARYRWTFGG